MDVLGILFVFVFYTLITAWGIFFTKWGGTTSSSHEKVDQFINANQNLGLWIGIFTLVATQVGGVFVNGTAEVVYTNGLLWCLAPIGYSLSLSINGWYFVDKVRDLDCITVIDVLQKSYGNVIGGLVYIPSCIGDICWTAAILSALGTTLQVMLGVEKMYTVIVSASIVIIYTSYGGILTVAHTDVIQLVITFAGLVTAIPFILSSDSIDLASVTTGDIFGELTQTNFVDYIDTFLLICLGGLPWQPYYQRALSMQTTSQVKILSATATVLSILCMLPPAFVGIAAKVSNSTSQITDTSLVLPQLISSQCPYVISLICLAALSAAAMSSMDSSLLAGASYISHNLYKQIFKPQNDKGMLFMLRTSVCILGLLSVALSISTSTIYGLWVLAGDLGYVVVFPQFFAAVHLQKHVNLFGSGTAALMGILSRLFIGEASIGIDPIVNTPKFADGSNMIPIKSVIMALNMLILVTVSKFFKFLTSFRYKL